MIDVLNFNVKKSIQFWMNYFLHNLLPAFVTIKRTLFGCGPQPLTENISD